MTSLALLDFTIVVLESPSGRVLLRERTDLPRVRVSDSEMLYRDIARELWHAEGVAIYILDNLHIDGRHVCIARFTDRSLRIPPGLAWGAEEGLLNQDAHLLRECRSIRLQREDHASTYQQFNALDSLREWYQPILRLNTRKEERVEHWQSTANSALLRIQTGHDAVWLKAVGKEYNTEPGISAELARLSPGDFPNVIETHAANRYMLFEDVPGDTLHEVDDVDKWRATAEELARLQSRFVTKREALLAAGCTDWSAAAIQRSAPEFFAAMEQIMAAQTSSLQPRFGSNDLTVLEGQATRLCDLLASSGVPNTLTHANFSPHNVIWSEGRPVFLDWAFGIVSFPFISIEYFRRRMERDCPSRSAWSTVLVDAYYRAWANQIDMSTLACGRSLVPAGAPLIAALNLYFQEPEAWLDDPRRAAALRALVRVFAKEVQHIPSHRERQVHTHHAEEILG